MPILLNGRELPVGCSGLILLATVLYLVAGLAVFAIWQFTGNIYWVAQFFALPSALFLVWLSALQLWFSVRVCGEFSAGEPMLLAWKLISASAMFDLAGTLGVQIFGSERAWNPLAHASWWSRPLGKAIFDTGHVLQGTFRFALLAAGLWCVLKLYRISGFLGRFRVTDWLLLAAFAGYCVREAIDLIRYYQPSNPPGWTVILGWPVDPLLCLLFAEAMLLHRSVQRTGMGLIGRCWRTFSAGIFLVLLGDVMIWATSYGYLPWPWSSLSWYVWMPAAASFALAPAYQLEAIGWASSGQTAPTD
ncbi:MAG TPA: hypothetical protein VGF49_15150 [Candidatus Solibacter sp.]